MVWFTIGSNSRKILQLNVFFFVSYKISCQTKSYYNLHKEKWKKAKLSQVTPAFVSSNHNRNYTVFNQSNEGIIWRVIMRSLYKMGGSLKAVKPWNISVDIFMIFWRIICHLCDLTHSARISKRIRAYFHWRGKK